MLELLRAYQKQDPAAKSLFEILFLYPGVKAIALHRLANAFYRAKLPILPRLVSEISRWLTGIEIHPGAQIGKCLVIDHGIGVVIGETAIVGNHVMIFHGVTLGGKGYDKVKRHPTVEDHVVIGAGAKILGNITIGKNARIGANAVVLRSIPPGATAVGVPAQVKLKEIKLEKQSHESI